MDLRYPIGHFEHTGPVTREQLADWLLRLESLPSRLREAVNGWSAEQLDTPYRPGGWTVRQVVHHVADSHMNSYIRIKLALTENTPTIKPYEETLWAELADGRTAPAELSLTLLEALHARWVLLLRSLDADQLSRTFVHPATGETIRTDWNIGNYAWHGDHHLAHITGLRERMGW